MIFTLFTNDPELAKEADLAGIDRIGLDMEIIGKRERQGHTKGWISDHQFEDLEKIRPQLSKAQLFVRTNPVHAGLQQEIDRYIQAGVKVLMLPMVKSAEEAAYFIKCIAGRAEVSLLVETPAGAMRLHEIVLLDGIGDILIGLNDMSMGMGVSSHFEVLASDFMESVSETIRKAGITFGFGGVARADDETLPVPSNLVYAQYARLKGESALISRVFTAGIANTDLTKEVKKCRQLIDEWYSKDASELMEAKTALRKYATQIRNNRHSAASQP